MNDFNGRKMRSDLVPNEPFRERYFELARQGMSKAEIAKRLGWVQVKTLGDTNRLNRVLGLAENPHGVIQKTVTLEIAERLTDALDMDPFEAGL